MDTFLLFGLIGFGLLIVGWVFYSTITNKIIKEQEKEIAELHTKIKRMELRRMQR